jgi:hypothetical protein
MGLFESNAIARFVASWDLDRRSVGGPACSSLRGRPRPSGKIKKKKKK